MTNKPDTMLWLSDARGVYIPRDFANSFKDRASTVTLPGFDWTVLENGPYHENSEGYWDDWQYVCDNATVTDEHGVKYFIWQDGDCWLVPEGMEWSDEEGGFIWPEDQEPEDRKTADKIDGYDRDDLGESPDY